jgi:hypothetical protein
MENNYRNLIKQQSDLFGKLTEHFTLDDWRTCRNSVYWECDKIEDPLKKLKYKINCVMNYLSKKNQSHGHRN